MLLLGSESLLFTPRSKSPPNSDCRNLPAPALNAGEPAVSFRTPAASPAAAAGVLIAAASKEGGAWWEEGILVCLFPSPNGQGTPPLKVPTI